jgi:hypothetical protein
VWTSCQARFTWSPLVGGYRGGAPASRPGRVGAAAVALLGAVATLFMLSNRQEGSGGTTKTRRRELLLNSN